MIGSVRGSRRHSVARRQRRVLSSRKKSRFPLLAATLTLALLGRAPIFGFGGQPPPPGCSKTVAIAVAAPRVAVSHGQPTSVLLPTFVFVGATECEPGTIDLEVTVTVNGGPGAGETTRVSHVVEAGLSEILLDVSVPAHAGRACRFSAEARATFADGSVVTSRDVGSLCLVSLAGTGPAPPPLDLRVAAGAELSGAARAHPGDATRCTIILTNNTKREFSGVLAIESINVSRRPTLVHDATDAGKIGVYSLANPLSGDDFPIALSDDTESVCFHLPDTPSFSRRPTLFREISVAPAETVSIEAVVRGWGLSSTGTLGKVVVTAEGSLADGTREAVCANAILAIDQAVPPRLECTDGGVRTALTLGEEGDRLSLSFTLPDVSAGDAQDVPIEITEIALVTDLGDVFDFEATRDALLVDGERGRLLTSVTPSLDIGAASRFNLGYTLRFMTSETPSPVRLVGATVLPAEPAPTAVATLQFDHGAGLLFVVEVLLQLALEAVGSDEAVPLVIESFDVVPDPTGLTELSVRVVAARPAGHEGLSIVALSLAQDLLGFSRLGKGSGCAGRSITDVFVRNRGSDTDIAWRITPPGCTFERIEIRDQDQVIVALPGDTTRSIVPCRHVNPFAGSKLCVVGIDPDGAESTVCVTTDCPTRPCPPFRPVCKFTFGQLRMEWDALPEGCCERIEVRDFLDAETVLTVVPRGASSVELSCEDITSVIGRSEWAVCVVCVGSNGTETKRCCEYVCPQAGQRPFDCTQDGSSNVSDAICILGHFFLAEPRVLPCNDVGNARLFDFNGDTRVDLSDAVTALRALFGDGAPHPLGRTDDCVEVEGCPEVCER